MWRRHTNFEVGVAVATPAIGTTFSTHAYWHHSKHEARLYILKELLEIYIIFSKEV